ncbi:MAG: hypothetical protein OXB84_04210 [Halobacteriovoraceae bacterium]|nr:hypothetical protein [Halobacteriovoraceae bacterium]
MEITTENWNYCFYKTKDLKAFISLGAIPEDHPDKDDLLVYHVTLSDLSHKEIYQKEFILLDDAIGFIQKKYGNWEFQNLQIQKTDSGCEDCGAH